MRRIRMFAVGLAAVFALGATSLVVASPALAKCNAECKQHKQEAKKQKQEEKAKKKRERAEKKKGALEAKLKHDEEELAKLPGEEKAAEEKGEQKVAEELAQRIAEVKAEKEAAEKAKTEAEKEKKEREAKETLEKHEEEAGDFARFLNCPAYQPAETTTIEGYEAELSPVETCFWAQTNNTSEFTAGKVKVLLTNPITLQGGLQAVNGPESFPNGGDTFPTVAPEDGAPELVPVAQPGPPLKDDVDQALLSPAEQAIYNYDIREGRTQTTVTIELATDNSHEVIVSPAHLLLEEGPAFTMPVKVKLGSAFVGNHCYVGSNEHPIWIYLTTGQSGSLHGAAGEIHFTMGGEVLNLEGNSLVDNEFVSPGVEGCGGDASVDEAMDAALGLPSLEPGSNVSKINGELSLIGVEGVEEHLPEYGLPVT